MTMRLWDEFNLFRRAAAFAAVWAAVTTAYGQPPKSVTLDYPGGSIRALLPILRKTTGLDLKATSDVESEVVCLRLREVPVQEALDRIAGVIDAQWNQQGETRVLERTPSTLAAEQKSTRELLKKAIDLGIEPMIRKAEKEPDVDPATARKTLSALAASQPYGVGDTYWSASYEINPYDLLAGLMRYVDLVQATTMPATEKREWSSHPNKRQFAFLPGYRKVIDRYERNYNIWRDAWKELPAEAQQKTSALFTYGLRLRPDDPLRIGNVSLDVHYVGPEVLNANLTIEDPSGLNIGGMGTSMAARYPPPNLPTDKQSGPLRTLERESALKIPPDVLARVKPFIFDNLGGRQPTPPDLVPLLLDPVRYEPLSLFVGPMLVRAADTKDENLVASLPDCALLTAPYLNLKNGAGPNEYLSCFSGRRMLVNVDDASRWITIRPTDPARERALRFDRVLLGAYLREWHENPNMSLERQAFWALKFPYEPWYGLRYIYERLLGIWDGQGGPDANCLRLYASLSPDDRRCAAEKAGIPLRRLSARARAAIDGLFNLTFARLDGYGTNGQRLSSGQYESDPLALYGSGIPEEASLRLSNTEFWGAEEPTWISGHFGVMQQEFDSHGLASALYFGSMPQTWGKNYSPDLKRIRYGLVHQMSLDVWFTPTSCLHESMVFVSDMIPKPGYEQFPAAFRAAVESELASKIRDYNKTHTNAPAVSPIKAQG